MDESDATKKPVEDNGATDDDESAASGERLAEETLPEEESVAEEQAPPHEPSLEEQLEAARAELTASRERTLRVAADFDNFRKRAARDVEDVRRRATQAAVRELLPVFDNLARATSHGASSADVHSLIDGLRMVDRLLTDTLAKLGIERVAAVGQPFDPAVHEGIQHDYSDEHPAGCVMAELQPGYRMGNELLRPALVIVSRGRSSQAPADGNGSAEPAVDDTPQESSES